MRHSILWNQKEVKYKAKNDHSKDYLKCAANYINYYYSVLQIFV